MDNSFLGKRLLIITAHPDDECFTAAGTIHKNHHRGGTSTLVSATSGENGKSHMKKQVSTATMKEIRENELLKLARFLHIDPVYLLGLPDGKLNDYEDEFYYMALKYAQESKPQAVLSFGETGYTGHHDHLASHQVAQRITSKLNLLFYTFELPPEIQKNALIHLKSRRRSPHYINNLDNGNPGIRIKISGAIKKQALSFHQSQLDEGEPYANFPGSAVREFFQAEYFGVN